MPNEQDCFSLCQQRARQGSNSHSSVQETVPSSAWIINGRQDKGHRPPLSVNLSPHITTPNPLWFLWCHRKMASQSAFLLQHELYQLPKATTWWHPACQIGWFLLHQIIQVLDQCDREQRLFRNLLQSLWRAVLMHCCTAADNCIWHVLLFVCLKRMQEVKCFQRILAALLIHHAENLPRAIDLVSVVFLFAK